jgi:polysaccharide biosynthesis protein PslH
MNIIFLCHRIPFPPNKGDKIRSYHILTHLAKEHTVHLGAFVDDPADMRHAETLRDIIRGECLLVPLGAAARVRMARALARGAPLSVSYFTSDKLGRWVDRILQKHDIGRAIVFSTAMAPYLLARRDFDPKRVIFDMVDVDSDKWRQYAGAAAGLRAWIYRREMRTLLALERKAAFAFGATLLVSPHETETFARLAPECTEHLYSVVNGVDLKFFAPDRAYPNPYGANEIPIVMTGMMDYWPNAEGAIWFTRSVLPLIRSLRPEARFHVVGARPSGSVRSLAAPDVMISGKVDDVRPYLAHAGVVVAPLKLARGLQNKVIEGMAMARPVVGTSAAAQALDVSSGRELWIADEPEAFAQAVIGALEAPAEVAAKARRYVEQNHDWNRNLVALDRLLMAGPRGNTSRAPVGHPTLPLARAAP